MAGSTYPASEVELKFLLPAKDASLVSVDPIFTSETSQAELRSVYYDTPTWSLHKAGMSLRVRHDKGGYTQTVKCEAGRTLFDRGQWEHRVVENHPAAAAWAATPAREILEETDVGPLAPVFSTMVRRASRLLREGTSLVEVSLDRGTIVAGDLHEAIEEVELELKDGQASGLFAIARRLAAKSVLRLSFDSKADRGYRLAAHETGTAEKARPVHVRGGMNAGEAFVQAARSCMTQVCSNAERLRDVRDPEILHQLRVGLRRFRAAFTAFKLILPGEAPNRLTDEIKWIGNELDPARDIDVFLERTSHATEARDCDEPLSKAFGERVRLAQTASYDRALKAVDSKRFARLLLDCAEWVEVGSWRRSKDPDVVKWRDGDASALAAKALDHLSQRLRKKGKHLGVAKPAARHRVRINAKKLRYAAEFFEEFFGKHAKKRRLKFIGALTELQDALGVLNDVTVARRTARDAAGGNGPLEVRAGQMVSVRKQSHHLLTKAVRAYERWRRAKPFWD